jgi:hypothetical protein
MSKRGRQTNLVCCTGSSGWELGCNHGPWAFYLGNVRVSAFAARRPRPTNPAFGFSQQPYRRSGRRSRRHVV